MLFKTLGISTQEVLDELREELARHYLSATFTVRIAEECRSLMEMPLHLAETPLPSKGWFSGIQSRWLAQPRLNGYKQI